MNYLERIEKIKPMTRFECFGTILYIAGSTSYPKTLDMIYARILFEKLNKLDKPEVPCIAGIYGLTPDNQWLLGKEYLHHLAIVTDINPIRITHRNGDRSPLSENEIFNLDSILKDKGRVEYRQLNL